MIVINSSAGSNFQRRQASLVSSAMACCLIGLFVLVNAQASFAEEVSTKEVSNESKFSSAPSKVALQNTDDGWQLLRDGVPYHVKGGGGAHASLKDLADAGANSSRTWGVDKETIARLDEAHQNGLSVAVGIWLEHERLEKLEYSDAAKVEEQAQQVLEHVKALKDHPAVLVWGIGNEMEGDGSNVLIWKHIEDVARRVKEIDPNHPTMTVIAEAPEIKIRSVHEYCPSIDIVGINAYGGSASLPARYVRDGGKKPYIVTEFGPVGTWEIPRNSFGAVEEASTTQKTKMYRKAYEVFEADKQLCLGSYAFLWGDKQEGTATWFGLLLPDGKHLATADTMAQLWSGEPPENFSPVIESFAVDGSNRAVPEADLKLKLKYSDAENDDVQVRWVLRPEAESYVTGGDFQETPELIKGVFKNQSSEGSEVSLPATEGIYRIYVYVEDELHRNAASANLPILVTTTPPDEVKYDGDVGDKEVKLPLKLYDEATATDGQLFVPSGLMGATESVEIDAACKEEPKFGETCMKCRFGDAANWAGLVWQYPANDWGELPGAVNLSEAKKLSFWARGKSGGEKVKFGYGLLGQDKKFADSSKGEISVELTTEWAEYSIKCEGDLSHIKSGFYWSLAGQGKPVEFYLDWIKFE